MFKSGGLLFTLARRDVGRNRRRTVLTLLAVALGLGLLITINSLIRGVMGDALANNIAFDTGDVQVRAPSYVPEKLSLQAADLITEPAAAAARAAAIDGVVGASPVLWLAGVVSTPDESTNVRLIGLEPESVVAAPYRDALIAGEYLSADDRSGVLVGRRLADYMAIGPGSKVTVAALDGNGRPLETSVTVRGVFASGLPAYDDGSVFLPLQRAQGIAGVGDRASAVVIKLRDQKDADRVASELKAQGVDALTWEKLNELLTQTAAASLSFYYILDLIVMLVVAVVIANTLLMSVFERVREMGILAALGLKRRQVLSMMLLEAAMIGIGGILLGIALGLLATWYLVSVGLPISEDIAAAAGNIAIGTTMRAEFAPGLTVGLALWTLIIILLAALYPAWFASRLEPVDALHRS